MIPIAERQPGSFVYGKICTKITKNNPQKFYACIPSPYFDGLKLGADGVSTALMIPFTIKSLTMIKFIYHSET